MERNLRMFVRDKLEMEFKYGWVRQIPNEILQKCEKRAKIERNGYHEIEEIDILSYMDFKDLRKIILKNWDIFSEYFKKEEMISNKLEELETPRNIIAHNRVISKNELDRLKLFSNDLKKCMTKPAD